MWPEESSSLWRKTPGFKVLISFREEHPVFCLLLLEEDKIESVERSLKPPFPGEDFDGIIKVEAQAEHTVKKTQLTQV